MSRRRGWHGRTWAMLWAVLQFALPAVVSGADAQVERDGRAQVAHVESTSASTCRPVHSAECALCQLLTQHASAPAHTALPAVSETVARGVATECRTPATAWLGHLPPARAPPLF